MRKEKLKIPIRQMYREIVIPMNGTNNKNRMRGMPNMRYKQLNRAILLNTETRKCYWKGRKSYRNTKLYK